VDERYSDFGPKEGPWTDGQNRSWRGMFPDASWKKWHEEREQLESIYKRRRDESEDLSKHISSKGYKKGRCEIYEEGYSEGRKDGWADQKWHDDDCYNIGASNGWKYGWRDGWNKSKASILGPITRWQSRGTELGKNHTYLLVDAKGRPKSMWDKMQGKGKFIADSKGTMMFSFTDSAPQSHSSEAPAQASAESEDGMKHKDGGGDAGDGNVEDAGWQVAEVHFQ